MTCFDSQNCIFAHSLILSFPHTRTHIAAFSFAGNRAREGERERVRDGVSFFAACLIFYAAAKCNKCNILQKCSKIVNKCTLKIYPNHGDNLCDIETKMKQNKKPNQRTIHKKLTKQMKKTRQQRKRQNAIKTSTI